MAKAVPITADDLEPGAKNRRPATMRQRGAVPSAELVPMQFRMPPEFAMAFRMEAVRRNMKYNELLQACFQQFIKD